MKVQIPLATASAQADHRKPETAVPPALTPLTFSAGLQALAVRDDDLARVVAQYGPPPLWRRKASFATLVRIILEQQVSLASARAAFDRLAAVVAPFSAARFRRLDEGALRRAGLTRQKSVYTRDLAEAIATGRLRLNTLPDMTDAEAQQALMQIKGIGPWSADIYLLLALKRPDIWPRGDLALNSALKSLKNLKDSPSEATLAAIADRWRPWRAVAARILWHGYLSSRGKAAPEGF